MKIEQLIVQYLYISKQVTLQGIGTFKLDPLVVLPAENDKDKGFEMPENAFQFEYNLKAGEDEGLVKYIVQHTRKILPLASADLDSYAILAKQFLNIGKPLVIEGVGTVQKNQQGNYQFTPGLFITPKIDDYPKQLREKRDESVSFESEGKTNHSRRNLQVAIVVLVVILSGLGIYYLLMDKNPNERAPLAQTVVIADTAAADTLKAQTDTTTMISAPAIPSDSNSFKIVLKTYPSSESAQKAFKRLSTYGHKLVVLKADSLNYELAMPFKNPLSDTARAKDSLRRFFGGKPYIKL
ncbi:MAG: hypothetical protein H7Z13_15455 [Ferruginibacter sp.]|nr:hypothetical protein [Ferruginibacter sp.]